MRTVIVTGGTRGIGAEIASAFYDLGDRVVVTGRHDSGLADRSGDRMRFVACDVRRAENHRALIETVLSWGWQPAVLINNAGASAWRPLEEIDEEFWDEMINTNLKSVLFASQAAAAKMGSGAAIINISSLAGKRGSANNSVYCAAKFGVNGLTQALAKELGPRGIRVNAVCPVYVTTPGLEEALESQWSPAKGQEVRSYLADFARAQSALGVLPTARQVAAACVFLASPEAAAITGQCLNVDCGVLPQ